MVRIVIGLVVCISLFVSGCASPAAGISPIFTASSNALRTSGSRISKKYSSGIPIRMELIPSSNVKLKFFEGTSTELGSRWSYPEVALSISPESATFLVIGPIVSRVELNGYIPYLLTRPNVGMRPTIPQSADGMRMEPPVSLPRVPIS